MTRPVLLHRDEPLELYVSVARESAQDLELSFTAIGVLTDILSRPSDWEISAERYTKLRHEGAVVIARAFRELTDKGYLHHVRYHVQTDKGARIGTQIHTWRIPRLDCGTPGCADCKARSESLAPRNLGVRATSADTPVSPGHPNTQVPNPLEPGGHIRANSSTEPINNPHTPTGGECETGSLFDLPPVGDPPEEKPAPREDAGLERFEEFWKLYPRKAGKIAARKAWVRALRSAPAEVIVTAAEVFADLCDRDHREERFIAHPGTWLNQGRWEDDEITREIHGEVVPGIEPGVLTSFDL